MSESELLAYRRSWKEATRRNNAAGKKEWTVRNFALVKLDVAEDWAVREKKKITSADPPSTPDQQPIPPTPKAPLRPTVVKK